MRRPCTTCKSKKRTVLLFKDCHVCRAQWRAFYAGQTPISPLMRAIEVDKQKLLKKRRKKALKERAKAATDS